jgi:hypothetical protein
MPWYAQIWACHPRNASKCLQVTMSCFVAKSLPSIFNKYARIFVESILNLLCRTIALWRIVPNCNLHVCESMAYINMHTWCIHALYGFWDPKRGEHGGTLHDNMTIQTTIITRDHQGAPGIIHPNCHFFQASPITSRMGPEGPQQNPDLQRSVATFLQLLQDGAPSPHMSPGTASGTKRWPVGFSMGSPGIMDYHGISWSPCIEMWLSIMVYHYL